jgi:methylmalonyl-CoA mutase C-terminal domain/subunit
VLLAKVGLDGHDVGIRLIARRLTDLGYEVIYLGKRNRPVDVASAALQEDADAVGISSLSGGAGALAVQTVEALRKLGMDVPVLMGGIAEPEELSAMREGGVAEFFGPSAAIEQVIEAFIRACAGAMPDAAPPSPNYLQPGPFWTEGET